jgi:predicted O-methyltransferase YrrM
VKEILRDRRTFYCYAEIENLRRALLDEPTTLTVRDLGAGSKTNSSAQRTIASIARSAATPPEFAQLLFRMAAAYQCKNILELGTSLGLTSLYLSSASRETSVITLEGDETISGLAWKHFQLLNRKNILLLTGAFEQTLPQAMAIMKNIDLVYLDGNHRKEPTWQYFNAVFPRLHEKSIVVAGDIHWSREMKEAWQQLRCHPAVTVSIDLFYAGILFFRKELSKQNFVIRN